jgi:hypothetical protein
MTAIIASLASLAFLVWAGLLFATLFALRGIGRGARYGGQPGLAATLDSYRQFLTAPEWRVRRRMLGLATVVMLVLFVLRFLVFSGI